MIEGNKEDGFTLICDYCEDEAEEIFDEFMDAVNHKKDYGWWSIKGKGGEWNEICPACAGDPDIVQEMRNK